MGLGSILSWPFRAAWRHKKKVGLSLAGLVVAGIYHVEDPTLIPRLMYRARGDAHCGLEQQFGITYRGDQDPERLAELEKQLLEIRESNPALLEETKTIVMHEPWVRNAWWIDPFVSWGARALPFGGMELFKPDNKTIRHEAAHNRHARMDRSLDEALAPILREGLQEPTVPNLYFWNDMPKQWEDGTDGPRCGLPAPYASKSLQEAVAEFAEVIKDDEFWVKPEVLEDKRFRQALEVLHAYGFASDAEYETICAAQDVLDPAYIRDLAERALEDLGPPVAEGYTSLICFASTTYFDNDRATVKLVSIAGTETTLSVTLKIGKGVSFSFDNDLEQARDPPEAHAATAEYIRRTLVERGYAGIGHDTNTIELSKEEYEVK